MPDAARPPAAAATPASGGGAPSSDRLGRPLTVVMGQQPTTLMPRLGSMLARAEVLGALQTEPVRTDEAGRLVAMGVEQVPSIENGGARWVGEGDDRHLEVTFRIRRGLAWHDGAPVTARDMRFHWTLMMSPTFRPDSRAREVRINAVDVVDDQTALVKYHSLRQAREVVARGSMGLGPEEFRDLREAKGPVVDPLFALAPSFLPEHILGQVEPGKLGSHPFARAPILCGPYRFKEWLPDQAIVVEAVDGHPLGRPAIPTIAFRMIPEISAQIAALQAGEVDVVTRVQGVDVDRAPELDRIAAGGRYRVHYLPGAAWEHLDFNLENEHLRERTVRKAIAHAINREQIVERVLFGKSKVAESWVQPGLPGWAWDPSCLVTYPFDPGRAKAMLTEAGYTPGPDGVLARAGRKLQLRLATTDQPPRRSAAQLIQAQLRQVGVGVELELMSSQALFEPKGPLRQRTFEMALYAWLGQIDPDREDYLHARNVPSAANGFAGNNFPGYRNPRVDELATQGGAMLDERQRKPIYCELQRIWTDDLPALPLYQRVVVAVARTGLANFKPTPGPTPETWNAHQWTLSA